MASLRADGFEIPLVLPLDHNGKAIVSNHLLHVRFRFLESSVYVEEEMRSANGDLLQCIPLVQNTNEKGHFWNLHYGCFRVYGLPLHGLAVPSQKPSRNSSGSSVDMPYIHLGPSPQTNLSAGLREPQIDTLHAVKVENAIPFLVLSSKSDGETPAIVVERPIANLSNFSQDTVMQSPAPLTFSISNTKSENSRPPRHPIPCETDSILECLKRLSVTQRTRNELSFLDYAAVKTYRVSYLPPSYDGNVIFELPPCRSGACASSARNLDGMDKRYDGHMWCKLVTTNIQNDSNLKFWKAVCVGHLACVNPSCDYLVRACERNETQWSGCTPFAFVVGSAPPKDSTIVCKVCKAAPSSVKLCDGRIYYVYSDNAKMTRAAIHLGHHNHPVAKGIYRDAKVEINNLLASEVQKTPKATTSAIALATGKTFMSSRLYHTGDGEKSMLDPMEMEEIMDRYQYLSSPNIRDEISSLRSNNSEGVLDNIMLMKWLSKFEFIHDSVFPGQGQEKVYLFKMLTSGPGSGVDLVKRMQVGGDLQQSWMMFDHVKHVEEWTTMGCHVYNAGYKKVMTIATCDMQSEDTVIQVQFWRSMIAVMACYDVPSPNFKGFMADSAMANWKATRIVFGSGNPNIPMVDRERTCLLHWSTSLIKHTQKFIKEALQQQHIRLCKEYKDSKTMAIAETRYLAIRSWWLSSGATSEENANHLNHWLAFWHFRYSQWGGFMHMKMSLEELADIPLCNLSKTVHNKWLQMSGNRGNNLFDATYDDSIRAWMQMTNYRAYLNGNASGSGPSKGELRLRAARRSSDPKKLAEALNTLLGAADIRTRIPHLEGEEVFGSCKRKADTPIGDEGDSHRPDKVNYSQPRVKRRSTLTPADVGGEQSSEPDLNTPAYVCAPHESDCDTSKWHIARISHKANAKCHAQQHHTNLKCTAKIARGCKGTPAPTYRGRKEEYGSRREVMTNFWFCPDDIECCVKGSKSKWVIDWPEVPRIWPVLGGTMLTREESILLQHAGFQLQTQPVLSPRELFRPEGDFVCTLYNEANPPTAESFPTRRNNCSICRRGNVPTPEQQNKWESAANVIGKILDITLLPFPGLGAIVTLETSTENQKNVYRITLGNFPACNCPDFTSMAASAIGGRPQYVNCKHLYYLFRYLCNMDVLNDKFIHAPSFSYNEVKTLLVKVKVIKVSK